jgi:hypothetical protein
LRKNKEQLTAWKEERTCLKARSGNGSRFGKMANARGLFSLFPILSSTPNMTIIFFLCFIV